MMKSLRGDHSPPPTLGQHTEQVLRVLLHYSDDKIRSLKGQQQLAADETRRHVRKEK
jgi:crotonobetainyl-CoA:carnitine CoA-transferase CaiB-like acyl-CoA transferase